ncbi:hypothetical protein KI387_034227, partial [Taxus chinensis]
SNKVSRVVGLKGSIWFIKVSKAEDYRQVEDGGCSRPCESQLTCGHACPRRCHPFGHDSIVFSKPCPKKFEDSCGHQCTNICHFLEKCPVSRILLSCGHLIIVACSDLCVDSLYYEPCPIKFECGHQCSFICGGLCKRCRVKVVKNFPRGHKVRLACCDDPATFSCIESYAEILRPDANISAKGHADYVSKEPPTSPTKKCDAKIYPMATSAWQVVQRYVHLAKKRPSKMYSRKIFIQTYLDNLIHIAGWLQWSEDYALQSFYYVEYMNTGPGAKLEKRVTWGGLKIIQTQEEANNFTVAAFISGSAWLPSTGISFTP